MQDLQAWFAPLLWIIATITAIVAFVRLCKPVWRIFSAPGELEKTVNNLETNIKGHFDEVNGRLDKYDQDLQRIEEKIIKSDKVQLSMLHDQIVQIYQMAKIQGDISQSDYKRACDLYAQDGEDEYIDLIFGLIKEMYVEAERKRKGDIHEG